MGMMVLGEWHFPVAGYVSITETSGYRITDGLEIILEM